MCCLGIWKSEFDSGLRFDLHCLLFILRREQRPTDSILFRDAVDDDPSYTSPRTVIILASALNTLGVPPPA